MYKLKEQPLLKKAKMMKNLLILTLVLGMASMANAAIVPTIDGVQVAYGDDVVAGMLGLDETTYTMGYDVEITASGDVTMSYGSIAFPLGFDVASAIIGVPTPTSVRMTGGQLFGMIGPGSYVTGIGFTGVAGTLSFYDHYNQVDLGSINVVPEPATIALLGLGAVALLRRRK